MTELGRLLAISAYIIDFNVLSGDILSSDDYYWIIYISLLFLLPYIYLLVGYISY